MKKFIIILCAIAFFSYSFTSTSETSPYVFLRVIECQGGDTANESMILIDYGSNVIEKISLEKFHRKNFQSNFQTIAKTVNDIKAKGYVLISSSGGGANDNAMILQNYIFKKQ